MRRTCTVNLTEDELRERGDEIARLVLDIEVAEEAKRDAAASHKARIDGLRAKLAKVSSEVRSKTTERDVDVVEELDLAHDRVLIVRHDTGEVVGSRTATPADRQPPLPGMPPPLERRDTWGTRAPADAPADAPTSERADERADDDADEHADARSGERAHERTNVIAYERAFGGTSPRTLLRSPERPSARTHVRADDGPSEDEVAEMREELRQLDAAQASADEESGSP